MLHGIPKPCDKPYPGRNALEDDKTMLKRYIMTQDCRQSFLQDTFDSSPAGLRTPIYVLENPPNMCDNCRSHFEQMSEPPQVLVHASSPVSPPPQQKHGSRAWSDFSQGDQRIPSSFSRFSLNVTPPKPGISALAGPSNGRWSAIRNGEKERGKMSKRSIEILQRVVPRMIHKCCNYCYVL